MKTHALSKLYGGKCAVDGLDLEIMPGEFFSLLGVNGAGKTTAVKMLSGLIPPSSGTAEIFGHDVIRETPEVKSMINISLQETAVAPNLSVKENLELICALYGMDKKSGRKRAENIIAQFSLTDIKNDHASTLSGGWMRRLSIAMALVTSPKILFLDEPTLGLDVLARRELWQMIETLKGHVTVILTTHYLEEAQALSDRIGIMSAGRLVACDSPAELMRMTNSDKFEDAFLSLCKGGDAA